MLPKVVKKRKKRVGRGIGSGKGGHTVGRGQKGQKARGNIGVLFEGVKVKKSYLKRLPLQRGKGKLKSKNKPLIVNVELLNLFPDGARVDKDTLAKAKIIREEDVFYGIKILGNGELKKKLDVALPTSSGAADKIKKAGGRVIK